MEIQLTDFENAAFSIFVVLLTRTILSFDLNFYMELSKVDENIKVAQKRNAVLEQKFWFRTNVFGLSCFNLGDVGPRSPYYEGKVDPCDPDFDVRRSQGRPSADSLRSNGSRSKESASSSESSGIDGPQADEDEAVLMTIDEIINGKVWSFSTCRADHSQA